MMDVMLSMPRVGQVFSTSEQLAHAILVCIKVRESSFGVHYDFFILDGGGEGTPFRTWADSKFDWMNSSGSSDLLTFGMTKAMKAFSFTRIA